MTYQEFFEGFKAKLVKKNTRSFKEHVAIQFTITDDDCGGVFYLEMLDGKLYIEPYSYDGCDASFECSAEVLTAIFDNKLKLCNAFRKNQLKVTGNMGKVVRFKAFTETWRDRAVRKPAKKVAAKKKPTAKAAPKTEAAASKNASAKKSAAKQAEPTPVIKTETATEAGAAAKTKAAPKTEEAPKTKGAPKTEATAKTGTATKVKGAPKTKVPKGKSDGK